MDNDAFKDLVRKQAKVSSSKEIARKAVEEEFSKKKKRKRGGGYASSSEEDEDDDDDRDQKGQRGRKSKKEQQAAAEEEEKERAKAVEEDLAARYRDRAKERREGGVTTTASGGDGDKKESTSTMDFLIVPHNKKGLDLSLIKKERERLKNRRQLQQGAIPSNSDLQAPSDTLEGIRSEMPTPEEAMQILEKFMDSSTSTPSASRPISHGVAEYVREFVKWTKETVEGRYDSVSCSHAGRNLQNTKLAFAIDGHPSDTVRAWQRPRQYTVASASSVLPPPNTSMLSSEVMDGIGRVFAKRNRVLSDMKQQSANNASSTSGMATTSKGREASSGRDVKIAKNVSENAEELEEVDDDDIFGGLDEYVPPAPKAKS